MAKRKPLTAKQQKRITLNFWKLRLAQHKSEIKQARVAAKDVENIIKKLTGGR